MTRIQIQHDDGTIQETEALGWVSNGDGLCAVVRGADGVPKLEPVEGPDGPRVVVLVKPITGPVCACGQEISLYLHGHRCQCGARYWVKLDMSDKIPRVALLSESDL